jgi:cell division septation protein DedD
MIRDEDDAKLPGVSQIRRKTAMSTQERGVYQPQEDFASYEDYPEEEGRSRLPLMIVIALVVVAAFGGVVWLAYNQGVAHGRAGAPPIVAAPAGPARTAPDESQTASGQPGTPYTGLKIYGEPVPPDEEAASSALAPQTEVTETALAEPTTPPPAVNTEELPPPAPAQTVVATPEPSTGPSAITVATMPQRGHATPPAPAVAEPTPIVPAPAPAAPPPRVETPPVQVATAEPPPAVERGSAATSGKAVLQIGSFPSPALANAAWSKFQRGHAGAVSGLSSDVMPVQIPGKGTWYRLRIGPFADRGAANTKCAQLKTQGATCLVATP